MRRSLQLAVLMCAAWLSQAVANAGELTLFGREEFSGREINVRDAVPDLARFGFDDRAGSLVIWAGRWEVCTRPDFRGRCRVLGPGEYARLHRLDNRISSLRPLDGDADAGQGYRPDRIRDYSRREPGVELFEREGFDGGRLIVREDLRTLRTVDFNDRAGSLIVYGGRWEFCQHSDFSGQCFTYGPGRYEHLGRLQREISSMRRVR